VATVSPNLCLSSPEKRCGKTRNLQILGCLVQRPLHTANLTVAALTRAIERYGPTLLIDEADTLLVHGGRAELRGILNSGLYRSTAFVLRCGVDRQQPKACSVWCPKAIALIGRLPSTLEDRSIVIPMRRRAPEERVDGLHYDTLFAELEPTRRKAARWALDHMHRLGSIAASPPETLHDRAQDLWRPLLAIAEEVGGDWIDRARRSAVELAQAQPPENSLGVQLLVTIRSIFNQQKTDRISSGAIVHAVADSEDNPWPDTLPLTKMQLARRLAPFGIRPTIVHRSRTHVSRGSATQHASLISGVAQLQSGVDIRLLGLLYLTISTSRAGWRSLSQDALSATGWLRWLGGRAMRSCGVWPRASHRPSPATRPSRCR
jgi:putative DNA primase/helicase